MLENTLRVLVADDIASNRTIVGAFLAHLNCTPLYAADGQEAVDIFRRESPDVVLLSAEMMLRHLGWVEAANLVINSMEAAIGDKQVTYDFARLMEGADELSCSAFGDAMIARM